MFRLKHVFVVMTLLLSGSSAISAQTQTTDQKYKQDSVVWILYYWAKGSVQKGFMTQQEAWDFCVELERESRENTTANADPLAVLLSGVAESGLNPKEKSLKSSASGIWQQINALARDIGFYSGAHIQNLPAIKQIKVIFAEICFKRKCTGYRVRISSFEQMRRLNFTAGMIWKSKNYIISEEGDSLWEGNGALDADDSGTVTIDELLKSSLQTVIDFEADMKRYEKRAALALKRKK